MSPSSATKTAEALAVYFDEADIQWKPDRFVTMRGELTAIMLAYVDNRAIMDRLDKVVGIDGWKVKFEDYRGAGALCTLSISFQGEWIERTDVSEDSAIASVKGGVSGSMKRAAAQWGIGRYLYKMPDCFLPAIEGRNGKNRLKNWGERPQMPPQFLPGGRLEIPTTQHAEEARQQKPRQAAPQAQHEDLLPWPLAGAIPKWATWTLKFGKFEGHSFMYLASGGIDGGRHSWLQHMTKDGPTPHSNPKYAENNKHQYNHMMTCIEAIESRGAPAEQEEYATPENLDLNAHVEYGENDETPF